MEIDLVTALARARSPEPPGPDTPAGPAVRPWPGPPRPLPAARPGELDLDRLLRLSLAAEDRGGRLRPAASAGALHPVDARLVVGPGCSLPPGRHGYDPLRHRVHPLGSGSGSGSVSGSVSESGSGSEAVSVSVSEAESGSGSGSEAVSEAGSGSGSGEASPPGVTIELSVTPQRTVSHYGHRAWPLLLLDTGHAAAALWLAARAVGAGSIALDLGGLGADPLAALRVSPPPSARASMRPPVRDTPAPHEPAPHEPAPHEPAARRSAPPPLRGAPSRDDLRAVLATAVAASAGELAWCAAVGEPHAGLVEPAADGSLRRLAAGEARPTLAAWAAGQAWLAQAGAVLLGYGCPTDADAPRIRRVHLRAGFAVHLAHVTAVRRGLAGRPVGSWQQADLGAALGGAPGRDWIVHGLALGSTHPEEGTS
ncbi:SagB/ThcOx family dehydrogenase [Streptomyces sp. NPDC006134]|uniref:SagB/ThcOx family dehydrogenase n=1 Tax=Streptomyces sp. NPDC006134 TaxID=3154467 RepID=UPI0033FD8872